MNKIPSNYFSDLSCYEEFVLKTNLLGKKISDKDVLNCFEKIENYYWTICNGHFLFLDNSGNKVDKIKVNGDFYCSDCENLTSLKGAPQKVGGFFCCSVCENLTSLKGMPQKIGEYFDCSGCKNLTSLEGAPQEVGGDFYCSGCNLSSLEGVPKKISRDFCCTYCENLTSLKGAPIEVEGYFICSNTNIPIKEIEKYKEFLKHPTPEHIDETGHYKP